MQNIYVVIDTGKANTKGMMCYNDKIYRDIIQTKIEEVAGKTTSESDVVVEYNGGKYLVGYGELNANITENQTKLIEEHRICAYTMIARLFELAGVVADKEKIKLTVNIPIIEFIKHEDKTKYHEFFSSDPKVTVVLNGNVHNFEIESVDGMFESSGYIFRYFHKYVDKDVLVVDVGGKNTTYCMFSNLKAQKDICGSLVYGGNVLLSRIRIKIQEMTGYDFNDTKVENIILGKDTTTLTEKEKEQVDEIINKQIKATLKVLTGSGMALNRTDIVFTGGTSKLYEPYLSDLLDEKRYTVSDMPLYDNVTGWMERARQ